MTEFKKENQIAWIANGEPIEEGPLNRPGREICHNTEFLKDHLDAGCQEKDFEHYAKLEKTAADGDYNSDTRLSAVKVNNGGYRVGEIIKVGDKEVMIEMIDEPDAVNPYYVLWVKGYGGSVPANMNVQSGGRVISKMVYIPRFVFPVHGWDEHYPTVELNLGGFWIDKYENSKPDATDKFGGSSDSRLVPTSRAGVVPWTNISYANAKAALERRIIEGRSCQMMDMWHFASVLLYAKLIGASMKGNTDRGKWSGDADILKNYGRRDRNLELDGYKMKRCLTGSGPVSWAHNESKNGVYDLFGNIREFIDLMIDTGVFLARRQGYNAVERSGGETELFVEFHRDYDAWPDSGILKVYIGTKFEGHWEDIPFSAVSRVGPEILKFTLSSPLPGKVELNSGVYWEKLYNVSPNTTRGKVNSATVLDGNWQIICLKSDVVTNRSGAPFVVGDIIQLGIEQMQVISVSDGGTYWGIVVARGYNGQTETVNVGDYFAVLGTTLQNGGPAGNEYQFCEIDYFRSVESTVFYLLPDGVKETIVNADYYVRYIGQRVGIRGGYWGDGFAKPWYLDLLNDSDYVSADVGFRGVLELDRIQVI